MVRNYCKLYIIDLIFNNLISDICKFNNMINSYFIILESFII